jgi:hypothetical protein
VSTRRNNDAAREEFCCELRNFRGLMKEVGESFILRREGEIETIISYLDTVPPEILLSEAAEWLREIYDLSLKPAKGRLKDLKRIDKLIKELEDRVIIAQEGLTDNSTGM